MDEKRGRSLRRQAAGILFFMLVGLNLPAATAAELSVGRDNKLHPQGWSVGDSVAFKRDTTVTVNELGEVISGVLAKDTFLYPRGWERVINDYYYVSAYTDSIPYWGRFGRRFFDSRYNMAIPGYHHLLFKGGSRVTFSDKGDVLSGTLANEAVLRLVEGQYGFISCRANTVLTFYESGAVRSAVLSEETKLRPAGWQTIMKPSASTGFIKFSANKPMEFNEAGEVVAGTLKENISLLTADGETKEFKAGGAVRFSAAGAESEISVDMP
ncbi:MAG: hypothetical protein E6X17_07505 [Sporomusaceae bacterium]|nr:hypothetical protein [Sporomusaceae bacterium]